MRVETYEQLRFVVILLLSGPVPLEYAERELIRLLTTVMHKRMAGAAA